MTKKEEVIALSEKYIRDVPGFPKPGIIFKDVTPVFENPEYLQKVFDVMVEELKASNIQFDKIVCPEARSQRLFIRTNAWIINQKRRCNR